MQTRRFGEWARSAVSMAVLVCAVAMSGSSAAADTLESDNYRITETQFGAGAGKSCSGSACAQISFGNTAVGDISSDNYRASFGSLTEDQPVLEVIVTPLTNSGGFIDSDAAKYATSEISIRNYLSSGYIVQLVGSAPSQGLHTLASLTSSTPSTPGVEQFGINLVDNSNPDIGANPVQVPSGQFSFGVVEQGYGVPDEYRYVSGQTVARSDSSSGQTNFTLSMIANVSNVTPGGRYSSNISVVVTPTF